MSFARHPRGRQPDVRAAAPRGRHRVVFHADDFGMNRLVTDGILRGFTHGLLTSTAILANAPDASRAIGEWQRLQQSHLGDGLPTSSIRRGLGEPVVPFELGIHLNLTQGRPLTAGYPTELLDPQGRFCGIGRLFASLHRRRPRTEPAVRAELAAQVEFLRDHGHRPTHLNGHQYIELLPGLRTSIRELLVEHEVPALRVARERGLRRSTLLYEMRPANWGLAHVKRFYAGRLLIQASRWNVSVPQAFFGTSHAGRINLELVRRYVRSAAGCQLIEIGVHPAAAPSPGWRGTLATLSAAKSSPDSSDADGWHDPLATQRPHELAMLTSPALYELLKDHGLSLGRLALSRSESMSRAA